MGDEPDMRGGRTMELSFFTNCSHVNYSVERCVLRRINVQEDIG